MKISKKVKNIYIISFFFSLHIALSAYVNSTFLTNAISEHYVGILYAVSSFIILFMLSRSSHILAKIGNKKFILLLLLVNMISILTLIKVEIPFIIGIAFVTFQSTNTLVFFCLDIFMEHFANPKILGKSRGTYLTINNLAWMLSPMLSGFLIAKDGGYKTIYLLALLAVITMTLGLIKSVKTFRDPKYTKAPFLSTYKFLEKNNHIFAINMIFFILQFFYVWMIIYTPIYLNEHVGLPWDKIGIIFTIMLVPFVLLGIPVGRFIDKYHISKRRLLYIGILIMGFSTLMIPFINYGASFWVWAIVLFMTRVGASMIETTSEIYFFTHVKENQSNLLSFFRDMSPVAFLVAPLLGTAIISFVDIRYMFFILSFVIFLALNYVSKLKHHHLINE